MIRLNGIRHDGSVVPFDLADRGLTLGDGLFETMAVFGGVVHRLDDHLRRLQLGLSVLGFEVPRERIEADLAATAAESPGSGGVIRLTVTRGAGARGLLPPEEPDPTVIVSLAPFDPTQVGVPARLAVASTRRNDRSPLSRLKSLGYLDNVLALSEARGTGATDALLLNTADRVASASAANIFAVRDGRIETPPASDGVLPGVIRSRVLELAPTLGFEAMERSLDLVDLAGAEAVFLTNSVRLLQPVTEIDGVPVHERSGAVGIVLGALLEEIRAECGVGPLD
jgi:branched-chain amino acid aminotransferase